MQFYSLVAQGPAPFSKYLSRSYEWGRGGGRESARPDWAQLSASPIHMSLSPARRGSVQLQGISRWMGARCFLRCVDTVVTAPSAELRSAIQCGTEVIVGLGGLL